MGIAVREAATDLLHYINHSPSPYHAVSEAVKVLRKSGYTRLEEHKEWSLKPGGQYFLTRNSSTLIAFALGEKFTPGNGCQIIGAHTDSPCLRVKQRSKHESVGYSQVRCECYGGGIWATWFDRDLKLAGKVMVRGEGGSISARLAHIDQPLLHIPTLAIHLDRTVNEAFKFNKEEHLLPVLGLVEKELDGMPAEKKLTGVEKQQAPFHTHHTPKLVALLADNIGCKVDEILGFDLCLADYTPAGFCGLNNEFLMAPRQDNLVNAWAGLRALADFKTTSSTTAAVLCLYDHEEVGSQSAHGAGTELTNLVLRRISENKMEFCVPQSFLLSADQVHAVHPNYVSKHEAGFQPALNGGVAIKHNSNQRYATTAAGAAMIRELARRNNIPLQEVMVRNDSPCGSTIGPIISANTAIRTVDLGCPQLSMHSIREMGGANDPYHAVRLYSAFYEQFGGIDAVTCDDGALDDDENKMEFCIPQSFLLSADQVHAVHPNYVSKHEAGFQPALNGGVAIKHNSNQRYATTAAGAAMIRELARRNNIPLQEVMVRNDSPCGSTIGPIISANTAIRTVDLGCPQLSMHSIREMGGANDPYHAVKHIRRKILFPHPHSTHIVAHVGFIPTFCGKVSTRSDARTHPTFSCLITAKRLEIELKSPTSTPQCEDAIHFRPLIFFSTPILREFIFSTISLKIQAKGSGTHRDQLVKELACYKFFPSFGPYLAKIPLLAEREFREILEGLGDPARLSIFKARTEESSASQYFQFYGYLSQQQNMLQDYVRTSTFQRAILDNHTDFQDKIVLDVGAGSGILSFFAVQAGAKHVYAVEASGMAEHCRELIKHNKYEDKITVIHGMIEEVEIPEQVDTIISEPMGYMLYNERMLETYIHARKWLKKEGRMFPTKGTLYLAPFSDEGLFQEVSNKANFWYQTFFYGVDLSNLRQQAYTEYFKQPIVDTFDPRHLVAKPIKHTTDFLSDSEDSLKKISVDFTFYPHTAAHVHGLAFWFDVSFEGSQKTVFLSTAPSEPLTHWYQVRCLCETPLYARPGQPIIGNVTLISNKRQSYDVKLEMNLAGSSTKVGNVLDLKNPYFRYTGAVAIPPGTHTTSPSEQYWSGDSQPQTEPMGYMLYNERMLETYIHARKWLKKEGRMFPTKGTLYLAPFSDEGLFQEVSNKANFWYQTFFYGVDLSNLRQQAYTEYFKQPIVDTFDPRHLVAKPIKHTTDFLSDSEDSLKKISVDFTFYPHTAAHVHGLAFWFDVSFEGSQKTVFLSTAPSEPLTHWYQMNLAGSSTKVGNVLDLKNPYFRTILER
eukprot:sb/3461089/